MKSTSGSKKKKPKHRKVLSGETAKYGIIWYDEDVHHLRSIKNEFPAIAFNDSLKSGETLSCEPTDLDERKEINELVEVSSSLEVLES
ncbi:hypothetical protein Tco_1541287 [Tanacetum coccineum]